MSSLSMSDAVVALKSFPRRFSEAMVGPVDDPAFVRALVHRGKDSLSVVDVVHQSTARLDALATTLAALPRISVPSTSASPTFPRDNDLGTNPRATITALLNDLKRAASAAADAVESRRADDLDREVMVDRERSTVGALLTDVVNDTVAALRSIDLRLRDTSRSSDDGDPTES